MGQKVLPYVLVVAIALSCGGGGVAEGPDAALDIVGDDGFVQDTPSLDHQSEQGKDSVGPVGCFRVGEQCDDQDPCTVGDWCREDHVCLGDYVDGCDDGLDCTYDYCVSMESCNHNLKPGWCLVNGVCTKDGDSDPQNPCMTCQTPIATDRYVPDNSRSCDDGNPCTKGDRCLDGMCVGSPLQCDDSNPCTKDFCENGICVHEPIDAECNDGNPCTTDRCENGVCVSTPLDCDDGNPCTDNYCDPVHGCAGKPLDGVPCDDGNMCTLGDTCLAGVCAPGPDRLRCDDGNPCTDDTCVPDKGCIAIPNSLPCDDGDPCTLGDVCFKGMCTPGPTPLLCDDGNICTDDVCVKGQGCLFVWNNAPCDDGDPCTVGDRCDKGVCAPGPFGLNCDDNNACTIDYCAPGEGCIFDPNPMNGAPCDDLNLCTEMDRCLDGVCAGIPILCDDGNDCTVDSCDPKIGCVHEPDMIKQECRPVIVITYPPRAATLQGNRNITIQGKVTSKAGFIVGLTVDFNGTVTPLLPNPIDGSFSLSVTSVQGINTIVVDAQDQYGRKDHVVQSYYFSTKWYPVDVSNPQQSMVKDGLMVFLGPEVWDDNNTSDIDDLATIMGLYIKNLDINSMIQNPIATGTVGWCDYRVNLGTVTFNKNDIPIDLTPVNGGLKIKATIKNVVAPFSARLDGFLCSIGNTDGTVTVDWITIEATLLISVDANGEPVVTATNVTVNMADPKVSVDNFLVDILKNFFLGNLKQMLIDAFKQQIGPSLEKAVRDALKGLALDQDISVPPLMPGGVPLTLKLRTKFSSISFTPAGGVIGFYATVVVPKGVPHNPLGSIGRAACLAGQAEVFSFPMKGSLELALHDDFFNQIPYGLYWGGGLRFPLDPAQLGQDLSQYGVTDLQLFLDFLLPPIITSCRGDGKMYLEIGDISVQANMKLFGTPIQTQLYASAVVEARLVAVQTPQGAEIGIQVGEPAFLDLEIASLSGGLAGAEETLEALLKQNFLPQILASFTGGAFGSFPIPEIDLSSMAPGLPPDAKISIELQEVLRVFGYTVLSGRVK